MDTWLKLIPQIATLFNKTDETQNSKQSGTDLTVQNLVNKIIF